MFKGLKMCCGIDADDLTDNMKSDSSSSIAPLIPDITTSTISIDIEHDTITSSSTTTATNITVIKPINLGVFNNDNNKVNIGEFIHAFTRMFSDFRTTYAKDIFKQSTFISLTHSIPINDETIGDEFITYLRSVYKNVQTITESLFKKHPKLSKEDFKRQCKQIITAISSAGYLQFFWDKYIDEKLAHSKNIVNRFLKAFSPIDKYLKYWAKIDTAVSNKPRKDFESICPTIETVTILDSWLAESIELSDYINLFKVYEVKDYQLTDYIRFTNIRDAILSEFADDFLEVFEMLKVFRFVAEYLQYTNRQSVPILPNEIQYTLVQRSIDHTELALSFNDDFIIVNNGISTQPLYERYTFTNNNKATQKKKDKYYFMRPKTLLVLLLNTSPWIERDVFEKSHHKANAIAIQGKQEIDANKFMLRVLAYRGLHNAKFFASLNDKNKFERELKALYTGDEMYLYYGVEHRFELILSDYAWKCSLLRKNIEAIYDADIHVNNRVNIERFARSIAETLNVDSIETLSFICIYNNAEFTVENRTISITGIDIKKMITKFVSVNSLMFHGLVLCNDDKLEMLDNACEIIETGTKNINEKMILACLFIEAYAECFISKKE